MKREQTRKEEIVNAISHGIGILFCLIAMPFLLIDSFNENQLSIFISVLAFGIGMLLVYTFSTLFHVAKNPKVKDILQIGDHISIYFLIAGTYTPFLLNYMMNATGITLLSVLWGLTIIGTVFKPMLGMYFSL